MIFEAPADQPHPIGDERRCQRVALEAMIAPAVERKSDALLPLDEAAPLETVAAHDFRLSVNSRALTVEMNSCVSVFRSATSHPRQPPEWCQYSCITPLRFSRR